MEMIDPLRNIGTAIRRIVAEGLAARESLEQILFRVRAHLQGVGLEEAMLQSFLAQATEQYTWVSERTLSQQQQSDVLQILSTTGSGFATVGGKVQQDVVREISRGIREGLPSAELEDILARKFSKSRSHSRTIANSSLQAFARADRFEKANTAGVKRFRYVGPSPEREFCRKHFRKVYTLSEINQLSNGQLSPVRLYCGGYNCRHQWQPVVD